MSNAHFAPIANAAFSLLADLRWKKTPGKDEVLAEFTDPQDHKLAALGIALMQEAYAKSGTDGPGPNNEAVVTDSDIAVRGQVFLGWLADIDCDFTNASDYKEALHRAP